MATDLGRQIALAVGLVCAATPGEAAAAPPSDDPDELAEHRSTFWEHAIDPDAAAVAAALAGLPELELAEAGALLDELVATYPAQPAPLLARVAWRHGLAAWPACAADGGAARRLLAARGEALAPDDTLRLAQCLARTGDDADRSTAVALLRGEIAAGRGTGPVRTSLGETLLASGRPEQAAEALGEVRASYAPAAWLHALAVDAAGDVDAAADELRAALARDPSMAQLERPTVAWIDPRLRLLAKGLTHAAASPPARATAYLRAYLAHADAPRAARAELALARALAAPIEASLAVLGTSGLAAGALVAPVQARIPACFAAVPLVAAVIEVDALGPSPAPVVTVRTVGDLRIEETRTETLTSVRTVTVTTNTKTGASSTRMSQVPKPWVGAQPPAAPAVRGRVTDRVPVPATAAASDEAVRAAVTCAQTAATALAPTLPTGTWLKLSWTVAAGVDGGAAAARPAATKDPRRRRATPRASR
jgi:hypothetical protein